MLKPATDFFPLPEAREPQVRALNFLSDAYAKGFRDIVIAAPTGVGKTGIGAAACYWGAQNFMDQSKLAAGGYYLVTQKLLQDQIERDFPRFQLPAGSIKSGSEYPCLGQYANCMLGQRRKPRCACVKEGRCRQKLAKAQFNISELGVTNYPYYFTSVLYTDMKLRRVVVCDECHTLERQLMSFVELVINKDILYKFAPGVKPPVFNDKQGFVKWLTSVYVTTLNIKYRQLEEAVAGENPELMHETFLKGENPGVLTQRLQELGSHLTKISFVVDGLMDEPDNWIWWQEENKEGHLDTICKPLYVEQFAQRFLNESDVRVYLSAYPGPKRVFCRSLGLEPQNTAWLDIPSSFPKQNRLVHLLLVGSMSRNNEEQTLPSLLRVCERIMQKHSDEKGLIHCHKYELGERIYRYLCAKGFANRVLFPRKARDRATLLTEHHQSAVPTVLISPSMSEGFSLDDDLARFQIIAKVPYPYLGDKQIAARKEADPDWYAMLAVMTVLQACGRIVRSETDFGSTYILDADFAQLLERHSDFFPPWFTEAFVDYKNV